MISAGFSFNYDEKNDVLEISQPEDPMGSYNIYLTKYDLPVLKLAIEELMEQLKNEKV